MKYKLLPALAFAITGCMASTIGTAGGTVGTILAVPGNVEMDNVYLPGLDPSMRTSVIDAYVASIDSRIAPEITPAPNPFLRVETILPSHAFSDVAEESWSSMETWYDGSQLKRLRMRPEAGRTDTEEFTYDRGRLVHVAYRENDGAGSKSAPAAESFYFGREGLISWVLPDGTKMSRENPDFQYWSDQLLLEAARFPGGSRR